jgi:hypothetical protein
MEDQFLKLGLVVDTQIGPDPGEDDIDTTTPRYRSDHIRGSIA